MLPCRPECTRAQQVRATLKHEKYSKTERSSIKREILSVSLIEVSQILGKFSPMECKVLRPGSSTQFLYMLFCGTYVVHDCLKE